MRSQLARTLALAGAVGACAALQAYASLLFGELTEYLSPEHPVSLPG